MFLRQHTRPWLISPGGEIYHIWQQINHPDFSAAYPPLILLLFRLLAGVNPEPFFFKAVMIAFDIGGNDCIQG